MTDRCPERDSRWPERIVCTLLVGHPVNLSPSGPHSPSELLFPGREVRPSPKVTS